MDFFSFIDYFQKKKKGGGLSTKSATQKQTVLNPNPERPQHSRSPTCNVCYKSQEGQKTHRRLRGAWDKHQPQVGGPGSSGLKLAE